MSRVQTIKLLILCALAVSVIASAFCLYYALLSEGTSVVDWIDRKRTSVRQELLDGIRTAMSIIPALAVGYSLHKNETFTRFGCLATALICVTFLVSTVASVLIDVTELSPGSIGLAQSVARLSSSLSTFSATIFAAVLGLKFLPREDAK